MYNKSEIEQSYTSNPITLDRNTNYEIALTRYVRYGTHGIILVINLKTIRLNTGKK